ncbi:MAG: NifU family protein [Acidimicrobiales bacterium]
MTELYGEGLARVVALVDGATMAELLKDELVSSLLTLHDLHPDDVATRVRRALDSVRPLLAGHGGDVELLDIDLDAAAVLIRLLGSCDGCPSSASTLQHAVEVAILEAAPEIAVIDVDQPAAAATPVSLGQKPSYERCPTEVVEVAGAVSG